MPDEREGRGQTKHTTEKWNIMETFICFEHKRNVHRANSNAEGLKEIGMKREFIKIHILLLRNEGQSYNLL